MNPIIDHIFPYLPLVFCVLLVIVIAWFGLVSTLYKILEKEHPQKYEEMGNPNLFSNKTVETDKALIKFIFKKEYLKLGTQSIKKHGNAMFYYLMTFSVLFGVVLITIIIGLVQALVHGRP